MGMAGLVDWIGLAMGWTCNECTDMSWSEHGLDW
jgi:hypothetical protein